MIELHNVTLSRSGITSFENFSFKIETGESYVIQGANGSGKTTLLELIAGTRTPQRGSIEYDFMRSQDGQERYALLRDLVHYIPCQALQTFLGTHRELFYQQRYYS